MQGSQQLSSMSFLFLRQALPLLLYLHGKLAEQGLCDPFCECPQKNTGNGWRRLEVIE
jgi:hypothetical protein